MTSDTILAFREFAYHYQKEKEIRWHSFYIHNQQIKWNRFTCGREEMCPDLNIIFSTNKLEPKHINYLFNIVDVTINIASNEGFGLGTCESLMAGTPIIVNVTGGLQDQCGFRLSDELLTYKDYADIESLHDWRKWENNKDLTYGEWVKPVWPKTRTFITRFTTNTIYF